MSTENVYIFIISSEYIEYVRSPAIHQPLTDYFHIQQVSVAVAVCQLMPLFRGSSFAGSLFIIWSSHWRRSCTVQLYAMQHNAAPERSATTFESGEF